MGYLFGRGVTENNSRRRNDARAVVLKVGGDTQNSSKWPNPPKNVVSNLKPQGLQKLSHSQNYNCPRKDLVFWSMLLWDQSIEEFIIFYSLEFCVKKILNYSKKTINLKIKKKRKAIKDESLISTLMLLYLQVSQIRSVNLLGFKFGYENTTLHWTAFQDFVSK